MIFFICKCCIPLKWLHNPKPFQQQLRWQNQFHGWQCILHWSTCHQNRLGCLSQCPLPLHWSLLLSLPASLLPSCFSSVQPGQPQNELEARHPYDCASYLCSRKKPYSICHKTWKHLLCQFPFHWQHKPLCDLNFFPVQFRGHHLRNYGHQWPEIPTDHNHQK